MYLPGQQSSSPANLTEPELPVTIPKCPAIHFHFSVSLASHCTFSDFLLEVGFFFFFTAITERKMLLAAGVQSPKRCCSWSLSSRTILVVYRGKNVSSVLDVVPRHGHGVPWPSSPWKKLCSDMDGCGPTAFWSGLNSWHFFHYCIFLTHFRPCPFRQVRTLGWTHF